MKTIKIILMLVTMLLVGSAMAQGTRPGNFSTLRVVQETGYLYANGSILVTSSATIPFSDISGTSGLMDFTDTVSLIATKWDLEGLGSDSSWVQINVDTITSSGGPFIYHDNKYLARVTGITNGDFVGAGDAYIRLDVGSGNRIRYHTNEDHIFQVSGTAELEIDNGAVSVANTFGVGSTSSFNGDMNLNGNTLNGVGVLSMNDSDDEALRVHPQTITSAQILASNTSPVELIAAPGAESAIVIHRVIFSMDYNSSAYIWSGSCQVRYSGGTNYTRNDIDEYFEGTSDIVVEPSLNTNYDQIPINEALQFYSSTDPTAGDSDIKIKIWYTIKSI